MGNAKTKAIKKGQTHELSEKYIIGSDLGEGGNAIVSEAKSLVSGESVALKRLFQWGEEKEARFLDEIKVMTGAAAIDGVMPVLDYSSENLWYTMPIATTVMNSTMVKSGNVVAIVEAFISLLTTLQELHDRDISHRDIKPANIYMLDGRFVFGDFGLVDFPEGGDLTQSDRPLGAIFTRAPEMLRNPKTADGKPADVYSMAKTLWMLLSKDEKGFDGQYNERDEAHRLNRFEHLKDEHLLEVEKLLAKATKSNPLERPTASEFKTGLEEWLVIHEDEGLCQEKDWEHLSEMLFGESSPDSVAYSNVSGIVKVLDAVAHCPAYNHMFVPKRGGLDLDHVETSVEEGCIKILGNGCWMVLKPKKLYFRGFRDIRWNYFLLETEELTSALQEKNDGWYEEVVEDTPGHYVNAEDACYGVYDYDTGIPLPQGWRNEERVLKGKFLFVMKTGHYNRIPATYDARHCDCSEEEFYHLISQYERIYNDGVRQGLSERQILSHPMFKTNPFAAPEAIGSDVDSSLPSPSAFIDSNYQNWVFSLPAKPNEAGIMVYYFIFDKGNCDFHSIFEDPKVLVLDKSGRIVERKVGEMKDVFFVSDRETAFEVEKSLDAQMNAFCGGYDTDFDMVYFKIGWERRGKPSHLFTKEEMEKAYREADDRRGNKLVIDEDGYARLIPTDVEGTAYPVCHESFMAKRNYVGKYSKLLTLDFDYMESLEAWLTHLERGIYVYCDGGDTPRASEGELIKAIKKYY